MSLHWRLRTLPELRELSKADRKRIWRMALRKANAEGALTAIAFAFAAAAVVVVTASLLLADALFHADPLRYLLACLYAFPTLMVFSVGTLKPLVIERTRPYMREILMGGT